MIAMKMEGWKELARGLEELGESKEIRRAMRTTFIKRAAPIVAAANARARRGVTFAVSTVLSSRQRSSAPRTDKNSVNVFIGATKESWRAVIDEFGTGPRYHKSGKYVGQMAPHPSLRPAWESGKDRLLAGYGEDLGDEIEKSAERIGRRQGRLIRSVR